MRLWYYLFIGSDTLEEGVRYRTRRNAIDAFREVAEEHMRYGNTPPCGYIHLSCEGEIVAEPDYWLSVGPRGGIRCERG